MKILGLDMSTRTGWALLDFDEEGIEILEYGNVDMKKHTPLSNTREIEGRRTKKIAKVYDNSNQPEDFYDFVVNQYVPKLIDLIKLCEPSVIVIEQTNKGRNRWHQKLLEWLHLELYRQIKNSIRVASYSITPKVEYIDTSEWRAYLGIHLSKDDRKQNRGVRRTRKKLQDGGDKNPRAGGSLTNIKHVAIYYIKNTFDISLKVKENDIAEAICIAVAWSIKHDAQR